MSDDECQFEYSASGVSDMADDAVEDDVYSYSVVDADLSAHKVTREYTVLAPAALLAEQQEEVGRIQQVCGLQNPSWARILLRKYHWNVEVLLTEFFDKGIDTVLKAAGIDSAGDIQLDAEVDCQACFDTVEAAQAYAPSCGHVFCSDCWTQYISLKVTEGQAKRVNCMGPKCKLMLDDAVIINFVTPDIREKFTRALVESYVNDNEAVKWCPSAPHCGNCVRLTAVGKIFDIHCGCGKSWCFHCLEVPHSPATCAMHKKWQEKAKDDSETCNWLKVNTKDCPHCHNAIEKDGGCNFVHCTQCSREFCWTCMFLCPQGQSHTPHDCNRYHAPAAGADGGAAVLDARESLQRYMHYFDRWAGHNNSAKFEAVLRERLVGTAQAMRATLEGSHIGFEIAWLEEGLEKLFQCRHILKNSYVFAFFMFDATAPPDVTPIRLPRREQERLQRLFEDHQQQLENTTEHLSGLLEQPADRFLHDRKCAKQIQEVTTLAESRLQGLYDVVHADVLKGDCGIIAPYHRAKPSPYHENLKPEDLSAFRQLRGSKPRPAEAAVPVPAAPALPQPAPEPLGPPKAAFRPDPPVPAAPRPAAAEDSELQEVLRRSKEEALDADLQQAIRESLGVDAMDEDAELQQALLASQLVR